MQAYAQGAVAVLVEKEIENILTQLRKKNVVIDKKISELYIPNMKNDSKTFSITYNFNIIYEK